MSLRYLLQSFLFNGVLSMTLGILFLFLGCSELFLLSSFIPFKHQAESLEAFMFFLLSFGLFAYRRQTFKVVDCHICRIYAKTCSHE